MERFCEHQNIVLSEELQSYRAKELREIIEQIISETMPKIGSPFPRDEILDPDPNLSQVVSKQPVFILYCMNIVGVFLFAPRWMISKGHVVIKG